MEVMPIPEMDSYNDSYCRAVYNEFRRKVLAAQQDRAFGTITVVVKLSDGKLAGTGHVKSEVDIRFKQ